MLKTATALSKLRSGRAVQEMCSFWPIAVLLCSYGLTHNTLVQGTVVICCGLLVALYLKRKSLVQTHVFHIRVLDLFIVLSIVVEFIAFSQSSFRFNSSYFLLIVFHAIATLYFVRCTCTTTQLRQSLFWCISLIGVYWAFLTIQKAYTMMDFITGYGFSMLSQFRNDYVPLAQNNEWTLFLILMLPFAMTLFLSSRRRLAIIISGITTIMLAYCIVIGFSRGGYLALGLFLILVPAGLAIYYRRALPRYAGGLLVGILLICACTRSHWPAVKATFMMNETISQQRSTESRLEMWEVAKSSLKTDPWFGVGAYNFALNYNIDYQRSLDEAPLNRATSVLTQLITEKGIIGVLIPVCLLVYLLISCGRFLRLKRHESGFNTILVIVCLAALTGVCIRDLTMSTLLFRGFVFHLFCIMIALLLAITEVSWRSFAISRRTLLVFLIPIVCLFCMTMWYEALTRYISGQSNASVAELKTSSFGKSLKYTENVFRVVSQHPIPHLHAAAALAPFGQTDTLTWDNIFLCHGDTDAAMEHLNTASALEPRDETIEFAKGWLYACQSRLSEALLHLNNAYRIDPAISVYPLSIGIVHEKQGNVLKGIEYYSKAMFLDPDLALSRFYREFVARNSHLGDTLLTLALTSFRSDHSGPIFSARQGALHYMKEDYPNATKYLTRAIADLPDLNRPYYYLGAIALEVEDTAQTLTLWNKSVVLDANDQLVNWKLGMLSHDKDPIRAASLFGNALKSNSREPFQRKRRVFYRRINPYTNSVLSVNLMEYISPEISIVQIRHLLDGGK